MGYEAVNIIPAWVTLMSRFYPLYMARLLFLIFPGVTRLTSHENPPLLVACEKKAAANFKRRLINAKDSRESKGNNNGSKNNQELLS